MRLWPLWLSGGCTYVFMDDVCLRDEAWSLARTGGLHSCGLHVDGTIECWGNDDFGKLEAPSGAFVALSAGYEHTCALDAAGAATCWGRNDHGQIEVPEGAHFASISAGGGHTCALDDAGLATCWGRSDFGQTSPPTYTSSSTLVTAGWLHTCLLDDTGAVSCVGDNRSDQAYADSVSEPAVAFDAGQTHTCAQTASGTICWGTGDDGRLDLDVAGATLVAAGTDTSCALDADGALSCLGNDDAGQASPPEGTFLDFDLGLGGRHGCAVELLPDTEGWTWMTCWGLDLDGQAGPPRE